MRRAHPFANDMTHDEWARCAFAMALRQKAFGTILNDMPKANRAVFTPRFERQNGRAPQDPLEVMSEIEADRSYQMLTRILMNAQDFLWQASADVVDRNAEPMRAQYGRLTARAKGTLRLNSDLRLPEYLSAADTHRMPGSFHSETAPEDFRAGALYDLGGAIYQMANGRRDNGLFLNDGRGHTGAAFLMNEFPGFAPQRILDMGCTVGQSTLPYADYFPQAEIHAIDTGAPVLRFAHARAEALGKTIHFSQQSAEATDFADGSFDLVMSHILLHETSPEAIDRILSESYRLLRAGGVMMHIEVPLRAEDRDAYALPFLMWEQFHNEEPNLAAVATTDFDQSVRTAGFASPLVGYFPTPANARTCTDRLSRTLPAKPSWLIIAAQKT